MGATYKAENIFCYTINGRTYFGRGRPISKPLLSFGGGWSCRIFGSLLPREMKEVERWNQNAESNTRTKQKKGLEV
jgi:hypothetical protein